MGSLGLAGRVMGDESEVFDDMDMDTRDGGIRDGGMRDDFWARMQSAEWYRELRHRTTLPTCARTGRSSSSAWLVA